MKLRKRYVVKAVVGVTAILLAALVSFAIKELLSSRNPQSALPVVNIEYAGSGFPAEHWMMESYTWHFINGTKSWEEPNKDKWKSLQGGWVLPGAPLNVSFSYDADEVTVERATGTGNDFQELAGQLTTPGEPGEYTYRLTASWGEQKQIVYYIRLHVVDVDAE